MTIKGVADSTNLLQFQTGTQKGGGVSKADKALDFAQKKGEKAATDFEALLLQQMFTSMWKSSSITGEEPGREEATFRDMLNEGLASNIAKTKGVGIAELMRKAFDKEAVAKGMSKEPTKDS